MKKILITVMVLFVSLNATFAGEVEILDYSSLNMKNFWDMNGKYEQKVLDVGAKLLNANKIDKRIAIQMDRSTKTINAHATFPDKTVTIYYGILPYINNDDELAFVVGHEMGHVLDYYNGGYLKWLNMQINSKEYEFNADLVGIDLMANAGYNPLAAICVSNRFMPEAYWDLWVFTSHPKTSKRLLNIYEYIYLKYPWALDSDMASNVDYKNFLNSSKQEINAFVQHERERAEKHDMGEI